MIIKIFFAVTLTEIVAEIQILMESILTLAHKNKAKYVLSFTNLCLKPRIYSNKN